MNTRHTILVIEDEDNVRDNIREILEIEDFEVMTATNGRHGLELAKQYPPDLVLCDVMMPELDGYGVLSALHSGAETALTPFIFLTAKSSIADLRHGMELGADDYLTKPFTPGELLKAIAIRLSKQRLITQHYQDQLHQATSQLDYVLHHDSLTQLPNHATLEQPFQQMQAAEEVPQAEPSPLIPLLVLRIDQFNRLHDTQGYQASNELIAAIALQLKQVAEFIPEIHTIARLSANQFTVLLHTITDASQAVQVAQSVLQAIAQPIVLGDRSMSVTTHAGIAFYPLHSTTLAGLTQCAELASNQAVQHTSDRCQVYTPQLQAISSQKRDLEAALRIALEQSQFEAYYQPQVDLATGRVVSAEALIRWQHPERGLLLPGQFIAIAEESGLIVPLGEWMIRTVCTQIKTWQAQGLAPVRVAVNLSACQFTHPELEAKIIAILVETGVDPHYLELELTESVLVRDVKKATETLKALRNLGIHISIDDFGVAYSSLNYLQQFTFDSLKVARSFVHQVDSKPGSAIIASSIIQMAHRLGLRVIGEGVETDAELAYLQSVNCDVVQGYIFSYPLPSSRFTTLLADQHTYSIAASTSPDPA